MPVIDINQSVHVTARISGYAGMILKNKQHTLGTHRQPATQAEVIELALALLEVSDADLQIDRARTLLWNALTRATQRVNIADLQTQMAKYKNPRGRRKDKPPVTIK